MIEKILLVFFILLAIVLAVAFIVSLIVGFGAFWASVGTAIYHLFRKEKVDKKKNKNFKINQGKEVK